MVKYLSLLLGPTIMIYVGLHILENIFITFLLFYSWLLLVPLIRIGSHEKAFVSKNIKRSIYIGSISGIIFFLFIFGGLYGLHHYFIEMKHLQGLLAEWGFAGKGMIGFLLVLLIVNPILEEMYWRGYLFEKAKIRGSAMTAI